MYGKRYCRFYSCLCSTSSCREKKKQSRFKLYLEGLKYVVSVKLQANLTNVVKYSNFTSMGLLYSLQNLNHEAACQEVQATLVYTGVAGSIILSESEFSAGAKFTFEAWAGLIGSSFSC